jgi:signal transduction histidine kinase/DNA-binding CsgD family transcriptional regulator
MRPRKYIRSGRAAPQNSSTSAQVIPLRAAADRGYRPNAVEPASSKVQSGYQVRNDLDTQLSLERQRLTAHDLQSVLCSTDVAIILLDTDLTIRFFTPATKLLFDVIPGDIGRPLTDMSSLACEGALVSDARKVLQSLEPIEREIETRSGAWYVRRILPYRAEGQGIEGIVITFADISHQKEAAAALECARVRADSANVAKSRFLAAASHDLRQPLQTLVLLQELLAKVVVGEKAKKLIGRLDRTLGSMSGMLNALLDVDQIEAGTACAEFETFRIDALLDRVTADLACQAEAQRIALRLVPCTLSVCSDPRLLEQMIRNLVSNALKYTKRGRVLLGCRRRNENLSIEVWDTGVGIPEGQLEEIFEEYRQLDNSDRDRSLGLGLGLSIVRRLGSLLDHPVQVRSQFGKGSVFSIEVSQSRGGMPERAEHGACSVQGKQSIPMAVEVMKADASDFLEKPLRGVELLVGVTCALELSRDSGKLTESHKDAADHLASLTRRQHQIMEMVLAGHPSKNIAADLGISQRTVENHRASIMKKTGSRSLPALARLAFAAARNPEERPVSQARLNFLFA